MYKKLSEIYFEFIYNSPPLYLASLNPTLSYNALFFMYFKKIALTDSNFEIYVLVFIRNAVFYPYFY